MPTIIRESQKHGPATEKDVVRFESLIKARLPEDYRSFLLTHNGGEPTPEVFFINESQGDDILGKFYGLYKEPQYSSLSWCFETNRGRMPSNIIPIGTDPGGNQVCLSVSGSDYGAIYFWDHEEVNNEEGPNYDNLYLLAPNFTAFLNGLTPNIDDEEE